VSRFVLRVGLLLALVFSVGVMLTNIVGRWSPDDSRLAFEGADERIVAAARFYGMQQAA